MTGRGGGDGPGGLYRLSGIATVLGVVGLVTLGLTAGVGDPGVVGRAGGAMLGAAIGLLGVGILGHREAVAAVDAKYDDGVMGTTAIGLAFAAFGAGVVVFALVA